MMSYSFTKSSTFTITHARYLASKVAADLYLCSLYYGKPAATAIDNYAEELAQLLKDGYVEQYEFGFKRNGERILCWRYTVDSDGRLTADQDAGKILSWVDVSNADYYNFLWPSNAWSRLTPAEREAITATLPIKRPEGIPPRDGNGYWEHDRVYTAGGNGLERHTSLAEPMSELYSGIFDDMTHSGPAGKAAF